MGIAQNHVEYDKYKPVWERCHDSVDGQDAIKGKTTTYLPKLPGMDLSGDGDKLYQLYLDNALWYPGTGRTFDAYIGTAFRKEPITVIPAQMAQAEDVFTADGQTINGFAADVFGEVVMGYRAGILVDRPQVNTDGLTLEEAETIGARPYASLYPADKIVNWGKEVKGGNVITSLVVLEESIPEVKGKGYDKDAYISNGYATLRRELTLDNGLYVQRLYILTRDEHNEQEYRLVATYEPVMDGQRMAEIPFIPVTPKGLIWDLKYPLINDIATLNLADYRNEALYRDALLFNGRPTPCVSGLITDSPDQKAITLGSSSILRFDVDGKWGTLGGGADASGLLESGRELKQRMALVGSRALSEDPRGVEAAETASLHRQGEDGVLSSVANGVSAGMTRALEIMRDWWPTTGEVSYTISTDFIPADVDPARMTAVWQMYVAGNMSFDAYYAYLERGEVYPTGWTKEKELDAIAERDKREADRIPLDDSPADASEE